MAPGPASADWFSGKPVACPRKALVIQEHRRQQYIQQADDVDPRPRENRLSHLSDPARLEKKTGHHGTAWYT